MKKLLQYFKQPYPVSENPWRTIFVISLFVSLFLVVFHPFGSDGINPNVRNFILAGYGGVTFVVLVIDLVIISGIFKKQFAEISWTVGRQILWLCFILFTIGLANYFYTQFIFNINISFLKGLLIMQLVTFSVGIFPIVLFSFITYNQLLKRNLIQAMDLDAQIPTKANDKAFETQLVLTADNEKTNLDVSDNQLIFISSEGNYSTVYYQNSSQIKKAVLRSTLKRMEDQLNNNPKLFRCHRAFIVNLQHIAKINGNSQGLQLKLTGDFEVPVSRNFTKEFKNRIQQSN